MRIIDLTADGDPIQQFLILFEGTELSLLISCIGRRPVDAVIANAEGTRVADVPIEPLQDPSALELVETESPCADGQEGKRP